MEEPNTQIYHEGQKLQFCLLHALNNLFQEKDTFTRAELNTISENLLAQDPEKPNWTPFSFVFKPHHNSLTGNYDVNVLIAALESKSKTVIWHDRRNDVSSINFDGSESGDGKSLMGIVINVPVRKFGGIWRSRHWVTIRKVGSVWYNLDSDFVEPQAFRDANELKEFLGACIGVGAEVFLVMNGKE
ncbi:Josephin domain [Dillenia turbinata]|uniref:ubiquitinyl hydrolase 1 n=1 Tax=Dillenia turbinata TaxID=194707 RepID=A0AAN8ZCR8_9MAGN